MSATDLVLLWLSHGHSSIARHLFIIRSLSFFWFPHPFGPALCVSVCMYVICVVDDVILNSLIVEQ